MYFRQLADDVTGALAYLVADRAGGAAFAVDPAPGLEELMIALVREQGLSLRHVLQTHVHAGERGLAPSLRQVTGATLVAGARAWMPGAGDCRLVRDGDRIAVGDLVVDVIETPGHTPGCVSYRVQDRLFCGDLIEIADCAEPAPETDPGALYDSVTRRVFGLPDETLVYPSHDRRGRTVSTVGEERRANRAFAGMSRDAFLTVMASRVAAGAEGRKP